MIQVVCYVCYVLWGHYQCLVFQSAVLGLRLKSGRNRNDLTIIYFYWCESKKRLMACVAELKSHLVKQLQVQPEGEYSIALVLGRRERVRKGEGVCGGEGVEGGRRLGGGVVTSSIVLVHMMTLTK